MPRHSRSTAHERKALTALSGGLVDKPRAPAGFLAETRRGWDVFWESQQAALIQPAQIPGVERLFQLRDERARCYREVRKSRMVAGSKGQPRRSPLYDVINVLDGEIRQLEDRFGLSPKAWIALGGAIGDAARSLADLNAELEADDGDDESDDPGDPRLLVLDGRAR